MKNILENKHNHTLKYIIILDIDAKQQDFNSK
jgi:hypothetical protein